MIHTSRTVTVGKMESVINEPIMLYRGDREVEIEFDIVGSKFMFSNGGNVIKSTNATNGQLVINTPTGENMFSEVTECNDGKVVCVITKEMIDELTEVGFYSFQIRLFDESQVSRVTIPPVYQGIEIRNPIAAEDETDLVDIGLVDFSVVRKDNYENVVTFLPNGDYNKTLWEEHDVISKDRLNKVEDALYEINKGTEGLYPTFQNQYDEFSAKVNKDVEAYKEEIEDEVEQFERDMTQAFGEFKVDYKDEVHERLEYVEKNLNFINVNNLGLFAGKNITTELNSYLNDIDCEVALYFPPGVYYIDNIVNLPKNIKIYGEKNFSVIKAISSKFRIYLNDNVVISNLTIDGGKDDLTSTPNILIDCNIEGPQIKNIVIDNCNIGNMNSPTFCIGVSIANANNIIIRNCNFDYFAASENGVIGDQTGTARSIRIYHKTDNCLIESCSFSGMFGAEDSDHIHLNLGADDVNTNVHPYNHEGKFNESKITIRGNIFTGCMKSAIKIQCSGVVVSDNIIYLLEDLESYAAIRVQNSSDCIIRNNTTYINENTKIDSVYTAQFAERTVIDGNTVIFKTSNSATSNNKPTVYYFYQVEKLTANNLNIIGDYNIKTLIDISGDNGYMSISNIHYNNHASILNIIYIEKNTDKTDINLNNINIFSNLNDYPILYKYTSNKGVIKLNGVTLNTESSFSGQYKIAYLRGSNEVYINNTSINDKIDLGACEKAVINNSKFDGLYIASSKLDMLIDNCRFREKYIKDENALHLRLGESKEYTVKVLNCIVNCSTLFTIGALSATDKIQTPTGVSIESINNLMCEQAIQDGSIFIRSADNVVIPYSIFKLKTDQFLAGNFTKGYYSSKKDINYLSGCLFLDDKSTNTDKGLYISNGNEFIKING